MNGLMIARELLVVAKELEATIPPISVRKAEDEMVKVRDSLKKVRRGLDEAEDTMYRMSAAYGAGKYGGHIDAARFVSLFLAEAQKNLRVAAAEADEVVNRLTNG
jgi:hypothetical protein